MSFSKANTEKVLDDLLLKMAEMFEHDDLTVEQYCRIAEVISVRAQTASIRSNSIASATAAALQNLICAAGRMSRGEEPRMHKGVTLTDEEAAELGSVIAPNHIV